MRNFKLILLCTVLLLPLSAMAQKYVNGNVADKDKTPLIGAAVTIKDGNRGVVTDMYGNYMIEIDSESDVLVFSYLGYQTQEMTVGSRININVFLEEEYNELDQVVVVGYGTQRKASVVGSIVTVEPEELQFGTARAMSNNLAGQLAGVIAVQRSGEPNYDESDVWIRGISSFGADTKPLVLVDGIERDINEIDPAEIESFSILKDAAASAVYGVRGANGVIIVTTKRGFIGKPKVSIRFEQSVQKATKFPSFIDAGDYMELLNELYRETSTYSGTDLYSADVIHKTRTKYDPDLYPDVNWIDEITNKYAYSSRANVNVGGGNETVRYALTASFYNETGLNSQDSSLPYDTETTLNRYNLRSNVDIDLTSTTQLRINVGGYLQEHRKSTAATNDMFKYAFQTPPHVHPAIYSDGYIPKRPNRHNPWAYSTQSGYRNRGKSKLESLFSLEQNLKMILPGLKAKFTFGFDNYSENTVRRSRNPTYYDPSTARNEEGELIHTAPSSEGDEFLGHSKSADFGYRQTYLEGNITYSKVFNESHNLDLMLLYNQRSKEIGDIQPYRNQGLAGRASYSYDKKYVGEFNFGYNGSENFASGHRYGFFPSVAAGWIMSEENFMRGARDIVSLLKFRVSYGTAGNDQLSSSRRFGYIETVDTGKDGYTWGTGSGKAYKGIQEGYPANEELTWETVKKFNAGFEINLWNSLQIQADYFFDHRYDILMVRRSIPTAAGYLNFPYVNYGKVDNKGVDMTVLYNKRFNDNFSMNLRGTFTFAKNKVIEYDEPDSKKGTFRSLTGRSIGTLEGYIAQGLYTAEDFNADGSLKAGLPTLEYDVRPGDIKYLDRNGDGVINSEDIGYIGGTEDPRIVYGFGGGMQLHRFDFSFFFSGTGQTYRMLGGTDYFIPGSGQGVLGNVYSNYNDRWTVDNPSQDVFWPRLSYGGSTATHNNLPSTWWKKDMSLLRLKTVELGYSLPENITKAIRIKGIRVYIQGNNLFYFSKFKLWDPELATSNGLEYPGTKSVLAGISVNF